MPADTSYRKWLRQDYGALIEALKLEELQKHFLRSRWLDQVLWMEGRADSARNRYYTLRMITIIGGVIVPALVSLKLSDIGGSVIHGLTFVISLLVAISAALEEFFHYGERWRHYRRIVELLKIEGWQFFQMGGPYRSYKSHAEAYPAFSTAVEGIIQHDVDIYITHVVEEKEEKNEKTG